MAECGRAGSSPAPGTKQKPRSNGVSYYCLLCGADRDRTDDLSIANAALSQLSYGPNNYLDKIIDRINTFQYKATHFELEVMRNNFEMNIKNMEIFFINSA